MLRGNCCHVVHRKTTKTGQLQADASPEQSLRQRDPPACALWLFVVHTHTHTHACTHVHMHAHTNTHTHTESDDLSVDPELPDL